MTTGDLHEIAPNLIVIEGHHPHAMWEDPDLPTIAAYRGDRTLYLFDTGAGPEQRAACCGSRSSSAAPRRCCC